MEDPTEAFKDGYDPLGLGKFLAHGQDGRIGLPGGFDPLGLGKLLAHGQDGGIGLPGGFDPLGLGKLLANRQNGGSGFDENGEAAGDVMMQGAVILIYNSSKERICKVADKVARGILSSNENLEDSPRCLRLPDEEVWDFELGDTVKIGLARDDFKWMQRKTLGWQGNLQQLIGQMGVVTNVYCKYENAIGVYFPDVFMGVSLYAGVLKKVNSREDPHLLKRWKVGDYVKTVSCPKVLALLQRGLDMIPQKYIGKTGRVVGVTHPCIVVTFNNTSTFDFKSSSLVPCDKEEIAKEVCDHSRKFKIGDKVKIISNLKKLITQQKNNGGWNADMTPICGANATVINIQKNGSLNVQTKNNRAWRINSDSVLRDGDKEEHEDDLDLKPGDVVKVIVPRTIRSTLAMAKVPAVFLEYLRAPAVVALVDDDFDYYLRFNAEQNVQTHAKILKKVHESEKKLYDEVKKSAENLEVDQDVYLDVGPPNFVRTVMAELKMDPTVTMAMTNPAKLEGFTNAYTAVIKYRNGTRVKIKSKFLTVPKKFHIEEANTPTTVSITDIENIVEKISNCVQDIHSREAPTDDWKVTLSYMCEGNPPCLEFRITSTVADFKPILQRMKGNSGWTTKVLNNEESDDEFIITRSVEPNSKADIKVGIIFNEQSSKLRDRDDIEAQAVSRPLEVSPSNATQSSSHSQDGYDYTDNGPNLYK